MSEHVLLVDEDAAVRDVVEQILSEAGYEVDATGTIHAGIALLRYRRLDLVISDAKLPDGSGMDVADAAIERGAKTLIITGHDFTLTAGQRDHYKIMPKPFLPIELTHAVATALRD
jgi:DNA-binding NtrC family response regulator